MRIASIIIIIFLFSTGVEAQRGNQDWQNYRHEAMVGFGFNSFLASIGEEDKFGTRFILQRSTFNASYRYYFKKHFAARGSFSHAYSRKNDKDIIDPTRINSRLDYQMTLTEFGGLVEYHIFDETTMGRRKKRVRRARGGMSKGLNVGIHFFAGVAVDYMRPYAELYGSKMVLKPYDSNAGFNSPSDYKKMNVHFPIGTSFRLVVAENWRIGLEAGYRLGVRDYIDNVSGVYYVNENPQAQTSAYADTQFTG